MFPDLVSARKMVDAGAAAVMPLAAPIGSNKGLRMKEMIGVLINEISLPVIVDAGIGKPSHAAAVMEMGASAVLLNTAIATSPDPFVWQELLGMRFLPEEKLFSRGLDL
jgi:thiazole synthase